MNESIAKASPRVLARVAGVLLLVLILGGIFAQAVVSDNLIVYRDAAVTAGNLTENQGWIRAAYTVYLIEMACQILLTALTYMLLRPAGQTVALAAACIDLAGGVIKTFSRVFFVLPLTILSSPALTAFSNEQVQQLALLTLQTNRLGPGIALAFFGVSGLLNGYLIFKSTFLPRWMGVISMAGSVGWMAFFYPPLGSQLFMFIAALALIGAAIKIFWFIVYGVDEEKWKKRAAEMSVI